jgi:hypothetical protein
VSIIRTTVTRKPRQALRRELVRRFEQEVSALRLLDTSFLLLSVPPAAVFPRRKHLELRAFLTISADGASSLSAYSKIVVKQLQSRAKTKFPNKYLLLTCQRRTHRE